MSITGGFIISGGNESKRFEAISSIINFFPKDPNQLNNPDTIIVKTDESTIGIDQIRDFQKQLNISPTVKKNKVGIIIAADKLTLEAQNSLLKTLEEPPKNTFIFLLCSDDGALIETILSRCQIVTLPQQLEELDDQQFAQLKNNLEVGSSNSVAEKFTLAAEIAKDRQSALEWLNTFTIFLHQSLISDNQNSSVQTNFPRLFLKISEAKKHLKANSNVRLTIENLFLNW